MHRRAVGIDLGTTNSLVAAPCAGSVETLADEDGRHLLPSVVQYRSEGPPLVGHAAKDSAKDHAEDTIQSIKRMLGKSRSEIAEQGLYTPYRFDESLDEKAPGIVTAAGVKSPVEISADILAVLADRATTAMSGDLEGVVITVPAYFNATQRQQTKDAAVLAGLNVLRLLNEPTAAAVAYGLDSQEQGQLIVYDLGGGTFDVSLLSLQRGVFEVLATAGDTNLGGDDFDQLLANWIVDSAGLTNELSASQRVEILQLAAESKHILSDSDRVDIEYGSWSACLNAEEFEQLCAPLIAKTITTCRRVLRDASMQATEIDNIVLVGGSTRMPAVRAAVAEFFAKQPLTDIDPDKVVAIGAGIQADVLIGNKSSDSFLLLDVNPLSLGIETMGELVEKIIPRNTTIPVAKAQEFTTFKDGQTVMTFHVVQGERELVSDCRSLARFELRGIPPMVAGAAKIRVSFQVDADGMLSVSAEELSTGTKTEIQVKPSYGLDADAIENMLKSSHDNAKLDMEARALKESQLDATQLIDAISNAIAADGKLLEETEAQQIDRVIVELQQAVEAGQSILIHSLTEDLNKLSSPFANRRMDLHIGKALKGESIDAVEQSTNDE